MGIGFAEGKIIILLLQFSSKVLDLLVCVALGVDMVRIISVVDFP